MEYVKLGELCDFINGDRGKNYPSGDDFINHGVPFINAGHLKNGEISFESMNYISEEKFGILKTGKVKKKDILYCLRGSLGKNAIVDIDEGAIASSLIILRPNLEKINERYLTYYLNSNKVSEQMTRANNGSSQPNLSAASVKDYDIYVPPLETQQKIADTLDKAQQLINNRKQQITELDNLTQSIFYDMFGDLRQNSMNWDVIKLDQLGNVGSSRRVFVEELVDNGIPFYRGTEIGDLATGEKISPSLFITPEHYENLKASTGVPKIGDLLLPSICPDGRIWIVDTTEPFYFKDGRVLWINLEKSDIIESKYLKHMLKEKFRLDYHKIASGTTFAELKIFILKDLDILVPPKELQIKFSEVIQKIEEQKTILVKGLNELENNFNSLMQKSFER